MNYYNEFDPGTAAWLRELITAGLIPKGEVDERSIKEVQPGDLAGFTQCHFFAGIGGWPYALRLAGWPEDRSVWTGSCPCQPFSCAGKAAGVGDERHLWPAFRGLISQCKPPVVFGEQVASADGRLWLAGVRTDLENMGYALGAADLCAAGLGAPHIRQRLYWVADAQGRRVNRVAGDSVEARGSGNSCEQESECGSHDGRLADSNNSERGAELQEKRKSHWRNGPGWCCPICGNKSECVAAYDDGTQDYRCSKGHVWLDNPAGPRLAPQGQRPDLSGQRGGQRLPGPGSKVGGLEYSDLSEETRFGQKQKHVSGKTSFWSASVPHFCRDGKYRRVPLESALFPLSHGIPGRVGLLRGAGNAIVPQVADQFIGAYLDL